MNSLNKEKTNVILALYKEPRSVFRLNDIAAMIEEPRPDALYKRLNYYVQSGKILNPRKGIYAKENYSMEELAGILYTPSYISFESVLQSRGITFQYSSVITLASYLSRKVKVNGSEIVYRKIKSEILVNPIGIQNINNKSIATPERAMLDTMYLDKNYSFDNISSLDKKLLAEILPIYNSKILARRLNRLLNSL